jgi:uncharacterized protein YcnI
VRALLLVTAAALVLPGLAVAHVTLKPAFVHDGVETEVSFQAPNERAPHATVSLATTAPPGVRIVSASSPPGWRATVSGSTATWTGGRIEGIRVVSFPIRVEARVRAGTQQFTSAQGYDDGATVRWKADLIVLPATGAAAPKQHLGTALIAGVAGVLVITCSLLALRLLRRRPPRER